MFLLVCFFHSNSARQKISLYLRRKVDFSIATFVKEIIFNLDYIRLNLFYYYLQLGKHIKNSRFYVSHRSIGKDDKADGHNISAH